LEKTVLLFGDVHSLIPPCKEITHDGIHTSSFHMEQERDRGGKEYFTISPMRREN